jgi:hypothetical protein
MTHWFPTAILLGLVTATATATVGCAQTPPVRYVYRAPDARAEAFAIEAAKHHPNAQPRVRPQYPEQAPPPLAPGSSLPAPAYVTRRTQPLQLAAPTFDDTAGWPSRDDSYSDYAPSYAYPNYYAPAYPAYGYRLGYGVGWRSSYNGWPSSYGYGWGARYAPRHTSWSSSSPHYHRYSVDHHHGSDYRPSLGIPRLSAPSHGSFHAGDRGSRPARTDIRLRR